MCLCFHNQFEIIKWEFPSGARSHMRPLIESYDFRNKHIECHLIIEACERGELKDCYFRFAKEQVRNALTPARGNLSRLRHLSIRFRIDCQRVRMINVRNTSNSLCLTSAHNQASHSPYQHQKPFLLANNMS